MNKDIKKEFQDLAGMIKRGFDDVDDELKKVKDDLSELKDGHKTIELRLDNTAPRFEVDDLKKRVGKLELKHA